MATKRVSGGSRSLVTLFDLGSLGSQCDRDLLECFQADAGPIGQEAFRILVERHGPMVLGLCRSLLRDQHEAEDAFQATFLVLVRRAASIHRQDTLGPWLHGVAAKVARRARGRLNLRRKREVPGLPEIAGRDRVLPGEFSTEQLVHEEIARLPESIQKPLVLCCLQGLSYDLAARQLGLNQSTVRGRLERARKRLSARLRERGVSSSLCAPALEFVRTTLTPLPSSLIESTVQFSMRWSRVTGLLRSGAVVPESVCELAQGVIHSMLYQTIRVSVVAIIAAGAIGTVVVAQQGKGRAGDRVAPVAIDAGSADADPEKPFRPLGRDFDNSEHNLPAHQELADEAPEGSVSFVDYEKKEVLVVLNRRMGARPQMKLSIIDARLPRNATSKPKAFIELTSIGQTNSRARIIKTEIPTDPIRVGDIAYSPLWSPNGPTRFALMGKIDMNRDGKDDRDALKRMIEEAGGAVEFDHPPPEVGKETGVLKPLIDWYVIDSRPPLGRDSQAQFGKRPRELVEVDKRTGEVIKEARQSGIRPMAIERLLAFLSQDVKAQVPVAKDERINGKREELQARNEALERSRLEEAAERSGEAKNAQIRQKLEMRIDAEFPKGETLETLLKHIKQVTTDANFAGIPIYVDPIGLSETNKTVGREVDLRYKQQPIRTILDESLRPLGLSYCVKSGFLMISSRTTVLENRVEEIDRKLDRILEMLGRLQPAR